MCFRRSEPEGEQKDLQDVKRRRPDPALAADQTFLFFSAPPGTRTRNPLIKSQLLCQLS